MIVSIFPMENTSAENSSSASPEGHLHASPSALHPLLHSRIPLCSLLSTPLPHPHTKGAATPSPNTCACPCRLLPNFMLYESEEESFLSLVESGFGVLWSSEMRAVSNCPTHQTCLEQGSSLAAEGVEQTCAQLSRVSSFHPFHPLA